jgi:hypothetical protein
MDVQKLQETFRDEWESIIADAKESLLANAAYYKKVLRGEEPIISTEEVEKENEEETEEPEEAQS